MNFLSNISFNHSIPLNIYSLIWFTIIPGIYLISNNYFIKNKMFHNLSINNIPNYYMISYIITATFCVGYLSTSSIVLFLYNNDNITNYELNLSRNEAIENHIIIPMLIYQIWNTVGSLLIKDLYSLTLVGHHLFVILTCYCTFKPFMQYLSIFFLGLVETSNIFLGWIELTRQEPKFLEYKIIDNIMNIIFILSFYFLRIIFWVYYSYYYLTFAFNIFKDIIFYNEKLDCIIPTIIILSSCLFLSSLQFLWGYKIYRKVLKIFKKNKI